MNKHHRLGVLAALTLAALFLGSCDSTYFDFKAKKIAYVHADNNMDQARYLYVHSYPDYEFLVSQEMPANTGDSGYCRFCLDPGEWNFRMSTADTEEGAQFDADAISITVDVEGGEEYVLRLMSATSIDWALK